MSQEILLYVLLAFIVGLAVGYLLLLTKRRALDQELTASHTHQNELEKTVAALEAECRQIPGLDSECKRLNDTARALESDRGRLSAIAGEVENLRQIRDAADKELRKLNAENAELREQRKSMELWYEKAKADFTGMFATLSKDALKDNRSSFLDLVTPFQSKLKDFEDMVDKVYRSEAAERNSLKGEIGKLVELNQQISKEASNLALALKGDTKKQGNWGELILEKVLEFSGLRKGEEYRLQDSFRDGQERKIPDAVIYLPDKKNVLIDAKVSLVAYERCIHASTDGEREAALLEHIASVKKHIKELSEKNYFVIPELDSPEFTLMFMPIESSFGMAVQADNELFAYAWDRKIVIVSPSTLLATLRTIASIWKQERQTKNALDIADRAGKMYDKFVGFVEDMISVGKKMDDAKTVYSGAMNKLSSGTGNLVRQAEVLRDMGAKATKQLPSSLVDRASEALSLEPIAAGPDSTLLDS